MEYLLTFHGKARDAPIPQPKPISPKQEFSLPPRNADDRRVFAYTEFDDEFVRQIIQKITVEDADTIRIQFRDSDVVLEQGLQ